MYNYNSAGGLYFLNKEEELLKIKCTLNKCCACNLSINRIIPVIDDGNLCAKVVFIGHSPGADEQKQGRPFVGSSGKLLDNMLSAIELSRKDIFIINSVSCRPDNNRDPTSAELVSCRNIFDSQIELIKPKIIVTLGSVATNNILNREEPISKLVGKWFDYKDIGVLPTFHPSYLLRNSKKKEDVYQHFLLLKEKLKEFV